MGFLTLGWAPAFPLHKSALGRCLLKTVYLKGFKDFKVFKAFWVFWAFAIVAIVVLVVLADPEGP